VQHDFTAAKVVSCLERVLPDGPARELMLEGLAQVKAKLRGTANNSPALLPADRAAQIILTFHQPAASMPVRK
jgi:hypothetical protein